jgi:four helix bundle protein
VNSESRASANELFNQDEAKWLGRSKAESMMKSEKIMSNAPQDIKERSFEFAVRIIQLCKELERTPGVSRTLANQILKSGTSIGANIEEANGSQSRADFTAKMYISCKESRETNYWLRLLRRTQILSNELLNPMIDESNQLIAILTTIVKKSRIK